MKLQKSATRYHRLGRLSISLRLCQRLRIEVDLLYSGGMRAEPYFLTFPLVEIEIAAISNINNVVSPLIRGIAEVEWIDRERNIIGYKENGSFAWQFGWQVNSGTD
ncbi:hypothetical protein [Stieleria sp.]|uniref:hypothetical protein n=1 Tax=Stieleria sp. TaxID=2795976 RepID=UPI003569A0D7